MISVPSFEDLETWELRRAIADLLFQRDVAQSLLDRAESELRHRRAERREGVVKAPSTPDNGPTQH